MDVSGQLHPPPALPPGKSAGTDWIGDWVGPVYKRSETGVLKTVTYQEGPDYDDMSSFFPCILCDSLKYINPGDELLVTKI
jgi:hypothetical protein